MSRKFDVIVYGSSGYTGIYVVEAIVEYLDKYGKDLFKWAIAGRNEAKLQSALSTSSAYANLPWFSESSTEIIKANAEDSQSLKQMTSQTRLLINCVGPYRYYGDAVVKACIETKTDYVDVSGEPQFLEETQLRYHSLAGERHIYVVPACGFDSLPCDLGVEFTKHNFPGMLNSVETILAATFKPGGVRFNSTTWDCIIDGYRHSGDLITLRRRLFDIFGDAKNFKSKFSLPRKSLFRHDSGAYCIPFPGSDRSVVKRSQIHLLSLYNERPTQMEAYVLFPLMGLVKAAISYSISVLFLPFKCGRSLLRNYPHLFTWGLFVKGGPTRDEVLGGSFRMLFIGKGWKGVSPDPVMQPDQPPTDDILVQVEGPHPGYPAAAKAALLSAVTILQERDRLPKKGGVYTPAAAFSKTTIVERLNNFGFKFQVLTQD